MEPRNPRYRELVQWAFEAAPFVQWVGAELTDCGPGWCESRLTLKPERLQQGGVAHACLVATLADHTAGGASGTLYEEGAAPLTAEFKINLLRPATGQALRCRAQVLKPGRTLTVVESEVFAVQQDGGESLVAKALVTLVQSRREERQGRG